MLTKILLTIAVIIAAILIVRHRKASPQPVIQAINIADEPDDMQWMIKWVAYGLVSLILLTGTVLYYLDWREDHRLYDIKIINPQTGKIDNFQAYKKDMQGRSFISLTGQRVAASDLERLEFSEAP